MMILSPVLRDANYMGYVGPLSAKGWNPTTHLAEVRYPVQSAPIVSVVKLLPANGLAVCNEAIAWLFLRAAGVQTPANAAVMMLSTGKIRKAIGPKNAERFAKDGKVVAWASQMLAFRSIQALFAGTAGDARWLKVICTVHGAAMAAFDETFLNCDRNNGNILFMGPDSCAAIDHEAIFAHQPWPEADIPDLAIHSETYRLLLEGRRSGKVRQEDLEITLNRMVHHAEKHADALSACTESIRHLLQEVFPQNHETLAERVVSFVAERTAREWMTSRLGVV